MKENKKKTFIYKVGRELKKEFFFLEKFFCPGHHLMNHAPPFQFLYKIHTLIIVFAPQNYVLSFKQPNFTR